MLSIHGIMERMSPGNQGFSCHMPEAWLDTGLSAQILLTRNTQDLNWVMASMGNRIPPKISVDDLVEAAMVKGPGV